MAAIGESTGSGRSIARKVCGLALVMLSATGCFTTTRTTSIVTPPSAASRDGMMVTAIVLVDGTSVRFAKPATATSNGSVTGYVEVQYAGTGSGTALRRVSYNAAEISRYRVERVERQVSWVRTLGLTLGVVAAPLAWIWIQIQGSE